MTTSETASKDEEVKKTPDDDAAGSEADVAAGTNRKPQPWDLPGDHAWQRCFFFLPAALLLGFASGMCANAPVEQRRAVDGVVCMLTPSLSAVG